MTTVAVIFIFYIKMYIIVIIIFMIVIMVVMVIFFIVIMVIVMVIIIVIMVVMMIMLIVVVVIFVLGTWDDLTTDLTLLSGQLHDNTSSNDEIVTVERNVRSFPM